MVISLVAFTFFEHILLTFVDIILGAGLSAAAADAAGLLALGLPPSVRAKINLFILLIAVVSKVLAFRRPAVVRVAAIDARVHVAAIAGFLA